jgi:8-oxo-dGTP pyrophosphatase MutT (NUDIX family)
MKPKFIPRVIHSAWNFKLKCNYYLGGKILGARALVVKDNPQDKKQVLLVRHTYTQGWYTIGGLIDRGETPKHAVIREVEEEAGIRIQDPKLLGVYYTHYHKRDDYILFYLADSFAEVHTRPSPEIAEVKWFDVNALPADISPSTQRRIDEYLGRVAVSEWW